MNLHLRDELASIRADEARRNAADRRRTTDLQPRRSPVNLLRRLSMARTPRALALPIDSDVRIRYARADDAEALARLAALDEAGVPPSPVLIAEVAGEVWAARSLATGQLVANPFRWTRQIAELLVVRADQLRVAGPIQGGGEQAGRRARATNAHAG